MEPDDYRPDPPAGLGFADFRAARCRYMAGLAAHAEIARLERAWGLHPVVERTGAGGSGDGIIGTPDPHRPGAGTP